MAKRSARERLLAAVVETDDCCWLYRPGQGKSTYGLITDDAGRTVLAHRFAYEAFAGPIPDGLTLDHICRRTRCCQPGHLEAVTIAENNRRKAAVITHCPAGHDYAVHGRVNRGKRSCKPCGVLSVRRARAAQRGPGWRPYRERTHCGKAGHELTPENTAWRLHGGKRYRQCRVCERQARRDWVAKRKAGG